MGGLPCKWKILNNSGTIESEAGMIRRSMEQDDIDVEGDVGYKVITELNTAEDAVFRAKRLIGEAQEFNGPWPHSLSVKGDYK